MPDFGVFGVERNENRLLARFLRSTYEVLNTAVVNGTDNHGNALFVESLLQPMRRAWAEMPPAFQEMETRILALDAEQLRIHGFTGAQLDFKLQVVNSIWERFNLSGGTKLFSKLIDAIDAILDSLIQATGVGSIIREIKEAIRNALLD